MELRINGHRTRTLHVQCYELGTDKTFTAAVVKNGPAAVTDARIWTSSTYVNRVGLRLTGNETWIYPGASSSEGFSLGDLNPSQEKQIDIKINLPSSPGRPGENLIPLFLGNGGAP